MGVQVDETNWGGGHSVSHAFCGALGDNKLRESFSINEIHIVRLEGAVVSRVNDLAEEEQVNVSLTDLWGVGVSEIEIVGGLGVLSWEWALKCYLSLVMTKHLVNDWTHHL